MKLIVAMNSLTILGGSGRTVRCHIDGYAVWRYAQLVTCVYPVMPYHCKLPAQTKGVCLSTKMIITPFRSHRLKIQ